MADDTSSRLPKLGKLGLALLEHLVEPVIGKDARDVIKAPAAEKELRITLAQILTRAEDRFIATYHNNELSAALVDLPLATLPSLQEAVRAFYHQPTDYTLRRIMMAKLSESFPDLDQGRVEEAIDNYLVILKEELVVAVPTPEFREKVGVLSLHSMQASTSQMQQILSEILDLMKSRQYPGSAIILSELQRSQPDQIQIRQIIDGILEVFRSWRPPALLESATQGYPLKVSDDDTTKRMNTMNQYDKLRSWLNYLVDEEFRDLIRSMLPTPQEQGVLPRPVQILSRGEFLGHMLIRRRLDELERYLCELYPNRFPT